MLLQVWEPFPDVSVEIGLHFMIWRYSQLYREFGSLQGRDLFHTRSYQERLWGPLKPPGGRIFPSRQIGWTVQVTTHLNLVPQMHGALFLRPACSFVVYYTRETSPFTESGAHPAPWVPESLFPQTRRQDCEAATIARLNISLHTAYTPRFVM
jgi:hypothetical protein